jgi:glycerol-3-phosphate acyltransferase PlsY
MAAWNADTLTAIALLLCAYLIGSIPFGLLFGKAMGVDVRQAGSGNIGATNVQRLLGKKLGIFTLLADAAKAIVPMLLTRRFVSGPADPAAADLWVVLSGACAFLGHLYPVYLQFKGGKGVATALGVFLVLEPVAVLISLAVFVFVVFWGGYVSLGSLVAAAFMPLWIWLLGGSALHASLALLVGIFIWLRHRDNLARLVHGEEKSWKKR